MPMVPGEGRDFVPSSPLSAGNRSVLSFHGACPNCFKLTYAAGPVRPEDAVSCTRSPPLSLTVSPVPLRMITEPEGDGRVKEMVQLRLNILQPLVLHSTPSVSLNGNHHRLQIDTFWHGLKGILFCGYGSKSLRVSHGSSVV